MIILILHNGNSCVFPPDKGRHKKAYILLSALLFPSSVIHRYEVDTFKHSWHLPACIKREPGGKLRFGQFCQLEEMAKINNDDFT